MSLDSRWVDAIHARLLVRYGSAWLNMWAGVSPELVKADWAEQLAFFADHPEAIKNALDNLPADKPPTVVQFRMLCRIPEVLPIARAVEIVDPVVLAAVRKAVAPKTESPKDWARRLRQKERACERLTWAQRAMWRAALGDEVEAA